MRFKNPFLLAVIALIALCTQSCSSNDSGQTVSGETSETTWSFGVMGDTQWTLADDGYNPNSVSVAMATQVQAQFIAAGVTFVVQVGDLTDKGTTAALDTRAKYAQNLYNAGVGFFPLRGNHESSAAAATEFIRIFPQTATGANNSTPADAFSVTDVDVANTDPASQSGAAFTIGSNFSSPDTVSGLSYSFDYKNARFIFLDQFTTDSGSAVSIPTQQTWITSRLSGRDTGSHAFVFSHKGLITEDHTDTLFGSDPSQEAAAQDAFITSLADNDVAYLVCGHDHMHDRTLITTTDGTSSRIGQLVCASNSSKFYSPAATSNDATYNTVTRQTALSQELNTVGYYIFTVKGDNVTVDYYSAYVDLSSGSVGTLSFAKKETFGYSLNGTQSVIAQGGSFSSVSDSHDGTDAAIISGTNTDTAKDGSSRAFSKLVTTGWSDKTSATDAPILTLWGLNTFNTTASDTYVISLSYDTTAHTATELAEGNFGIISRDNNLSWKNTVSLNTSGTATFVDGSWSATCGLGSYGVDTKTGTVWATVDHTGTFSIGTFK